MKIVARYAHLVGAGLLIFTGTGHTIGMLTADPGVSETAARALMDSVHPMAMAPERSLLDFYLGNSWLIGLMYVAFGLLLWMTAKSTKVSVLAALVSGISAAVAFRFLPLPPAIFLTASTLAWISAAVTASTDRR